MKFCLRVLLVAWLLAPLSGIAAAPRGGDDIVEALSGLTGVTHREVLAPEDPAIPKGYRRFDLTIEQPVDHFDPSRGNFRQRLALLHKDTAEPTILQTSGYKIFAVKLSALALNFGTNQLQVEHRFFEPSSPAILDWNKLDIVQSAYDFHRILVELKKIYKGRWVNTGGSKGGMTSVYYRRFFPDDLDGTVADVAPLSFSTEDARYIDFVDQVGGKHYRQCRENLERLQIELLRRRGEVLGLIAGSFVYLGGKSVAFEHAVIELPFVFWQYLNPEDPAWGCAKIPAAGAPASELAAFVEKVSPLTGDTDLFSFMPYYYQAATQLGAPGSKLHHLAPYRLHDYRIGQYTPPGVSCPYSNAAMRDVEQWVREQSNHILFVYGELDPWSAAAFPRVSSASDFHWFEVPGSNHRANLFALPAPEKERALTAVRAWLGKQESWNRTDDTLDAFEADVRRRHRLP